MSEYIHGPQCEQLMNEINSRARWIEEAKAALEHERLFYEADGLQFPRRLERLIEIADPLTQKNPGTSPGKVA